MRSLVVCIALASCATAAEPLPKVPGAKPRNIVFVLCDDHRHDAIGCLGHPFLETPHLDSLVKNGAHFKNAFVTTSLCSPSRASILTGLYAHRHGVVDNNHPVDPKLTFFAEHLKAAGYRTGFFGKWHMGGDSAGPQRGFDRWVSFPGQGVYRPNDRGLNVDGQKVPQKGYITDELTDYALDWLKGVPGDQPFMMYLSHKAVHSEFIPADRHKGRYADKAVSKPKSFAPPTPEQHTPMWVQNQRNSWHGVDFPYHTTLDVAAYYRRYCETLLAVDDSVGRLLAMLKERGQLEGTLVVYMGDNGFMFGEHGLIDKRCAYETSMRVPLVMHCPELFNGATVNEVVANIDIAPTFLAAAGLQPPDGMDGTSVLHLPSNPGAPWRENLLYEYYWERNFPQTPTMHAVRGSKYKYIRYHGIWDTDELYDLEADPDEMMNLIDRPEHKGRVKELNGKLFTILKRTNGMQIPLLTDSGAQMNIRNVDGPKLAGFPPDKLKKPNPDIKRK